MKFAFQESQLAELSVIDSRLLPTIFFPGFGCSPRAKRVPTTPAWTTDDAHAVSGCRALTSCNGYPSSFGVRLDWEESSGRDDSLLLLTDAFAQFRR